MAVVFEFRPFRPDGLPARKIGIGPLVCGPGATLGFRAPLRFLPSLDHATPVEIEVVCHISDNLNFGSLIAFPWTFCKRCNRDIRASLHAGVEKDPAMPGLN
jgi:hypothetical protein